MEVYTLTSEDHMELPQKAYFALRKSLPSFLTSGFSRFFFSLSPDIPYDVSKQFDDSNYLGAIRNGYLVAFILYFVTTCVFSYFEGVLFKQQCEASIIGSCDFIPFSHDIVNIIMYVVIVPLMFGFGMALMTATFNTWKLLGETIEDEVSSIIGWKGLFISILILVVASIATASYISDVATPLGAMAKNISEKNIELLGSGKEPLLSHYWFLGRASEGYYSPITIFYAIINFVNLLFIFCCVAAFITASRPIVKLSSFILSNEPGNSVSVDTVVKRISAYGDVYFFVKILMFITMIHSIVWSYSPLALGSNMIVEQTFIAVVAIFFIAIPRIHFEVEWYRVIETLRARGISVEVKPPVLRGVKQDIVWILDYLLIGGYIISVTGVFSFGPYA